MIFIDAFWYVIMGRHRENCVYGRKCARRAFYYAQGYIRKFAAYAACTPRGGQGKEFPLPDR